MSPTTQFIISHLWESTLFASACGLLILVLGRSWSVSRHLLAWAGLVKFVVPFAAFSSLFEKLGAWYIGQQDPSSSLIPYVANLSESLSLESWMIAESTPTLVERSLTLWESVGMSIWMLGLTTLFTCWVVQYTRVRASIRTRCQKADEAWQSIAERVWEKSPSTRPTLYRCEDKCLVAGVFGFWRPIIIIPATLPNEFNDLEREAFLRHEFQHIYKRDNLWILIQKSVRNLVWFHPLAWWFDHQISAEREIMRDAEVIRTTNHIPSYLNCLMKASNFNVPNNYANTVGINGSAFSRRVKAIHRFRPTHLLDRLSALGSITAIIALTVFLSSHLSVTELQAAETGSNSNPSSSDTMTSEELQNDARKRNAAILEYYHANRDQFHKEAQVRLRIIRIAPTADGNRDQQLQRADEIMEALKAGEAFEELAKEYGNDVMNQYGGDWGWINRSDLRKELTDPAFSLEIGDHSEPIPVGRDLFVIKVENRDGPRIKSLGEVRDQILKILMEESNEGSDRE